jgi:allantoinase
MLPHHGRYAYSAITKRPVYVWPDGSRLAVYVGVNLETFAFGEGFGAELAPMANQPDVLNYSWRDYGNRVGAWRLLEMFDSLRWPTAALINSAMYDDAPELLAAFRARGDEIVGHGRTNAEKQGTLPEAEEHALIAEATQRIRENEGRAPAGWLGPWISQSATTPDLLAEAGYRYLLDWAMDDQPVMMRVRGGGRGILSVPYPQELNDIPAIVARKNGAAEFADMIIETFDEMLEQAVHRPMVMGIALHPYLVGQPHRLRPLRRALQRMQERRDLFWLTTPGAIAEHCLALPPRTLPGDAR